MSDFRVLRPRSLPQSVNIAAGNGRLFMANDASFKSDTYSRETHVRKAANTHTALTPGDGTPGATEVLGLGLRLAGRGL